uniref:C-type lectin domain-containing protein n=1 Tax=Acrobeloides nanus TaxID=290746 RepID=A0A914DVE9_9BILA
MMSPGTSIVEQNFANNLGNDESAEDFNYGDNSSLLPNSNGSNIENANNVRRRSTTWNVANQTCENGAAHLVSIHHQEEENFVKNLSGNFSSIPIGLYTYASTHHFIDSYKWTDGSTVNYSNWADDQPPEDKHTHCVFIDKGKWNANIQCTLSDDIVYVCKKPAAS